MSLLKQIIGSRHGIYKKVLLLTLAISITPVILFGFFTLITLDQTRIEVLDNIESAIDQKVREALELQAFHTANEVSRFLKQCENDLKELSDIIPTDQHYHLFSTHHNREIWRRGGTPKKPLDIYETVSIYKEISYIDHNGWEKIKIIDNSIVPKNQLQKVSDPKNTTYKIENYFNEASSLSKGRIHVTHLIGYHMSKAEQLGDSPTIEEAFNSPNYNGVIRFSMPIVNNDQLVGVVTLALDHRHLMEFTQHILPISKELTVFPVYNSGNYAFMFDDRGWAITHPKFWDIPGIDSSGNWVKAYNKNSTQKEIETGRIPFNLDTAEFVHPNYPFVASEVRKKKTGSVITTNIGGVRKVMAYAPIIYNKGVYDEYGIFGGITIGAELKQFQKSTSNVAKGLSKTILLFRDNVLLVILFTFILTAIASRLFSKSITTPIVKMTAHVEKYAADREVKPVIIERNDEIGVLSKSFNNMVEELEKSNAELIKSFKSLRETKQEIANHSSNLEYQLTIFKSIQQISNILGSSTAMETVLEYILQSCIKTLKFDRAVLYLLDNDGKYLEYQQQCGLSLEEERRARRSRYNIENQDCIETRVQKTGEIIFVKDFNSYDDATEFDKRIYRSSQSDSFVYVPLKVKEKIIGILGSDRYHTKEEIKDIDINSLQIFANQASRIIENSQLYQEINKQKNFFEDIIHYMVKGVITIDNNGVITSVNQAARTILELQNKKITGLNSLDFFKPNPTLFTIFQEVVLEQTGERSFLKEFKVEFNRRQLVIGISMIDDTQGSDPGYIILLEDVTEKKMLDDHLHHLDRLASLGKFAAGIAHEIRNPLTGISVFLDDLHDKVSSQSDTANFISMGLKEIERLETLVSELLEYATPAGAQLSEKDINAVIKSTLHFTEKQCRDNNIKVELNTQKNIPSVKIDAEKIRQAILNIILNAVQFLSKDGIIRITTQYEKLVSENGRLMLQADAFTGWIKIIIEDSGPGIPSEDLKHIFEPFFTKRQGGTGLGLSITHSIIAEHDGKIEVTQSGLQGACFAIYLPVTKK